MALKCTVANSFYALGTSLSTLRRLSGVPVGVGPVVSRGICGASAQFFGARSLVGGIRRLYNRGVVRGVINTRPVNPGGLLSVLIITPMAKGALSGRTVNVASASIAVTVGTRLHGGGPIILKLTAGSTLNKDTGGVNLLRGAGGVCFMPCHRSSPRSGGGSLVYSFSLVPTAIRTTLGKGRLRPMVV